MTELATAGFRTLDAADAIANDSVVPYYLSDRKLRVAVARVDDRLYAFGDLCTCTDEHCPLSGGLLTGTMIMCQCHGSRFDITTGAVSPVRPTGRSPCTRCERSTAGSRCAPDLDRPPRGRRTVAKWPRRHRISSGVRWECKRLDDLIQQVRSGVSATLVVRGEPGIGKTALLDYCEGRAQGCRVARVAGVESELELPLAGVHQLCAPLLRLLPQLPDPQRAGSGDRLRLVARQRTGPVPGWSCSTGPAERSLGEGAPGVSDR